MARPTTGLDVAGKRSEGVEAHDEGASNDVKPLFHQRCSNDEIYLPAAPSQPQRSVCKSHDSVRNLHALEETYLRKAASTLFWSLSCIESLVDSMALLPVCPCPTTAAARMHEFCSRTQRRISSASQIAACRRCTKMIPLKFGRRPCMSNTSSNARTLGVISHRSGLGRSGHKVEESLISSAYSIPHEHTV